MSTVTPSFRSHAVELPPLPTLDAFRNWALSDDYPESGRVSFLHGVVEVDTSPQAIRHHGGVVRAILTSLGRLVDADDLGDLTDHCTMVSLPNADVASEPDIVFVSHESLESKRVVETPKRGTRDESVEFVGPPDLIVQVVSDSSVTRDRVTLREAYETAGVAEYWIVDCRGESILFNLLRHDGTSYDDVGADADGWRHSGVFACDFRLTRERGRGGRWRYRLESRD